MSAVAQPSHSPRSPGVGSWILIALFVTGIASLLFSTAETAQTDLALLTASFLYVMGISQAGIVFVCICRLVRAQWAKPYYRLAELSTLAFLPFAFVGFLLIYIYGQDELFYWLDPDPGEHLSPWLNINWLLIRNLFGLVFFYGLAVYYVMKGLKPDLEQEPSADHRAVEDDLYLLSPVVLIAYVITNTFISWDFGMMLIAHWHSTVFPILYWFGNVFAGTAALIAFPALLSRGAASPFGLDQVKSLGMVITGFTLMWLYFFWAQFFVTWFGNLPHETEPLWRQMYGHYGPYFWTMMTACFFFPFAAFIFAFVKRSIVMMSIIALGINVGIWLFKYLLIVPVFSESDRPFDSLTDLGVSVGLAAGFLAVLVWLARRYPMYSHWELALPPRPRRR